MHSDLDYEVLRLSLPAGVVPAYDGMRLTLESVRLDRGGASMIGLFFEVQTRAGHRDQYLDLAAVAEARARGEGGCLSIERFKSLTREDLLLSHQIWQDEGALTAWRVHGQHHKVQELGREQVFADYRIRIAQVIHEARPGQPVWQPERRTPYNDPARRQPTYVLAAESKSASLPVETDWRRDAFESVYREGQFAHLIDLPDPQSGIEFGSAPVCRSDDRVFPCLRGHARLRHVRARRGAAILSARRTALARSRQYGSMPVRIRKGV